jgi:hypothetical protein
MTATPAATAAARTRRASSALLANGFSLSTCLPASIAARFQGPCSALASGL